MTLESLDIPDVPYIEERHGLTIKIMVDDCPDNPMEWGNEGSVYLQCEHRKYVLGHGKTPPDWDSYKFPLYMIDHSGISLSLEPFECLWDSGQVGTVHVNKRQTVKYAQGPDGTHNVPVIAEVNREDALKYAQSEVKTYDQYVRGVVFGFVIEDEHDIKDSCGGFYGDPNHALDEARRVVDHMHNEYLAGACNDG